MANTFHLDDLVQPATRAEVQASMYAALGVLGVNTTSWKPGAVVRTMFACTAAVLAGLSSLQARIARMGFLELSEGEWLTLVARYVYGVERIEATFATGTINLHNSGGGIYSFDPDDLIFATAEGVTYRNSAPVTIGALADASVDVRATVAGTGGSAAPATITTMVTVVIGLTCSNPSTLIGTDEETDPALVSRCRERLGALSPFGPWDAYTYAVRTATRGDGTTIGVTRTRIVKDGFGTVTVYLAGAGGAIPGDPNDPDTDLGIASEAVQRLAAPLAVNAVIVSASNVAIAVTYEVWLYNTSGQTEQQIRDVIEAALIEFARAQPIGGNVIGSDPGKVFVEGIAAAIHGAMPEIFRVSITAPALDVTLAPSDVAIAGVATATAIHQEPPPEGFSGAL